jgi:hypothetical protein
VTAHLTDAEINEAGDAYVYGVDGMASSEDFCAGARYARDHYDKREALWRELVDVEVALDDPLANAAEHRDAFARWGELRAALGTDKEPDKKIKFVELTPEQAQQRYIRSLKEGA